MHIFRVFVIFLVASREAFAENEASTSTTLAPKVAQPVYKPPEEPSIGYIPHQTYPFFDAYGGYDSYYPRGVPLVQPPQPKEQPAGSTYTSGLIPATQSALQFTLKVLAKFGLFLIGGATLLLVGGIFTTAVCSLTPICVISFPGFNGIDKESVRSLMTPDRISAAAAMVQDAIGKYQRLQRAVHK